jgi:hypothetical protein
VRAGATRYQHGQFQGLFGIEAWIDLRSIRAHEIGFRESSRAPDALGHILAGKFDMHTA